MKIISSKLVSVQPISLSKAARYISDFASFENNGASEVISIYLNRASEAFSSLVQLHKDLKHPQSSHKKQRKKTNRDREDASSLRGDETVNRGDGERKSGSNDENRGELDDKRVEGWAKEEDESARVGVIEDVGRSKKRKEMHKKEDVKLEVSIRSGLLKGDEGVDRRKKKKKKKNKNDNVQKGSKMEDSVDEESRGGENGSGSGVVKGNRNNEEKKIKKRKENETTKMNKEGEMAVEQGKKDKKKKTKEIEIKEMRREGKLNVDQETESKRKKRKSVDLDDDPKENVVELSRKKSKKSKVAGDKLHSSVTDSIVL